jgi:hypothetical protein
MSLSTAAAFIDELNAQRPFLMGAAFVVGGAAENLMAACESAEV